MTLPLWRVAAGTVALALCAAAQADEHERTAAPLLPRYQQECSACHIAYPPGLLPAASWQRLLNDLPHHFGTDASLDPATVGELSTWLTANAAPARRWRAAAPAPDRITTSAWFVHEHREVPAAVWKRPAVRSASNCAACHTQAEQGVFDEHDVRIPR
jgi:hypothetical protein